MKREVALRKAESGQRKLNLEVCPPFSGLRAAWINGLITSCLVCVARFLSSGEKVLDALYESSGDENLMPLRFWNRLAERNSTLAASYADRLRSDLATCVQDGRRSVSFDWGGWCRSESRENYTSLSEGWTTPFCTVSHAGCRLLLLFRLSHANSYRSLERFISQRMRSNTGTTTVVNSVQVYLELGAAFLYF